jgi:hypothetical protein
VNTDNINDGDGGYIIEYVVIGNSVKVTAFDPKTLKEVSVIGIRGLPKKNLANLAIRKLEYVIGKTDK